MDVLSEKTATVLGTNQKSQGLMAGFLRYANGKRLKHPLEQIKTIMIKQSPALWR
jgi:hypothetical protein